MAVLASCGLETPNAQIEFRNESDRIIGITKARSGLTFAEHFANDPAIRFIGVGASIHEGWATAQPDPLCETPEALYYIVDFDLPPQRYDAGETSIERFTVLETIGPNICWDSKRPTFTFAGSDAG